MLQNELLTVFTVMEEISLNTLITLHNFERWHFAWCSWYVDI